MGYKVTAVDGLTKMASPKATEELVQGMLDKGVAQGWKLVTVTDFSGGAWTLFWETPG